MRTPSIGCETNLDMAGSAEFEVLIRHMVDLQQAVKENLISLGARLVSAKIIFPSQYHEIRNTFKSPDERAADLVEYVINRVHQNPQYYYAFIDALRSDQIEYGYILAKLEESYGSARLQYIHPSGSSDRLCAKGIEVPAKETMTFCSSMSEEDFFKWLRSRGISDRDCKKLSENGITPLVFTKFDAEDFDDIGFTKLGKKLVLKCLAEIKSTPSSKPDEGNQFNSANLGEEAQKMINVWVDRSKSLRIVVFGKTGTGKSSLVNTLFNKNVAKEGSTLYTETKAVHSYTRMISLTVNDVCMTLWDTPGLEDPFSDGKRTLKEITEKCGIHDIDLFIYCTRFDQPRLGYEDFSCIRDITKAFGEGIWKRTLLALTFANTVTVPPSNKTQSLQEYFQVREIEWREGFRQVIKMSVRPEEIHVSKIPILATGCKDAPSLPDGRNWFADFWEACLLQVKITTMPALIHATEDWVKGKAEHAVTARIVGKRLQEIGDQIVQELGDEMHTDSSVETLPQVTATAQWSDFLIKAIQQTDQLRNS